MTLPDPWLLLACVFGLLVVLGTTSGLINEHLWMSEPLAGAAMRLPAGWVREHWRGLAVALGPGMVLMWTAGAAVTAVALGLPAAPCFLTGAALAPTDPVLSAPILTGRLARRAVPAGLRHALTAESGTNDGLALPCRW